jgi:hypothetical protein
VNPEPGKKRDDPLNKAFCTHSGIDIKPTIGLQKQSFSGEVAGYFIERGEQP